MIHFYSVVLRPHSDLSVVSIMSFTAKGSRQESTVTFSCYVCLVFSLEQFPSLSLTLKTFPFLKITGQLFCSMSVNLRLFEISSVGFSLCSIAVQECPGSDTVFFATSKVHDSSIIPGVSHFWRPLDHFERCLLCLFMKLLFFLLVINKYFMGRYFETV